MAKVSGCLCWPKMLQSKRKDQKENSSQPFSVQNSTFGPTGDRSRQSIPKEHDEFIEMLFRPGRHRSRTLTTSLFSPPKGRSDAAAAAGSNGGWFRRRTNSLLSANKRYSTDEDLHLFETVPATPGAAAAFQREMFSFTLPLRGWNNDESATESDAEEARGRAPRRSDVWPEYIWRLNQKRQQRCPCAGCEDAAEPGSCARVYRHPVRHTDAVGAYLDDEDDGSTHSVGVEESGLDRRRGSRGYDRPKSKGVDSGPYDVPGPSSGWMFCGRGSLKDRGPGERRTNSAEFQARPRSASLEQRAFRSAAARGGGGGERDFPGCSWRRCGDQGQQQEHYDRPIGLYPLRPGPPLHPGHRRGCHGLMTRSSVGLRCFACELRLETMSEEWSRMGAFYLPGRSHGSHRAYDGGDSGYIQSDQEIEALSSGGGTSRGLHPELNYVIPSGMFAERKNTIRCHGDSGGDDDAECDDYLMPLSANFKRFQIERGQTERYLAMNSGGASARDRNEALPSSEDIVTKIPPQGDGDIERQREKEESCDEKTTSEGKLLVSADKGESDQKPAGSSVTSGKSVEDEPEGKEMTGDSAEKISILVHQEEGKESKKTPTETPVNANTLPSSENKELANKESVRSKEVTAAVTPPVATRAPRSHLDLLHMSPPPQCSFMVDHSYMNVADSSEKSTSLKNDDMEEMRNKEQNAPKNEGEILYFASKTKTSNEYLDHWQDVARLNKQPPGSQYVVLHKKASSGNNYCHTYLPTLRENLKNSCRTK